MDWQLAGLRYHGRKLGCCCHLRVELEPFMPCQQLLNTTLCVGTSGLGSFKTWQVIVAHLHILLDEAKLHCDGQDRQQAACVAMLAQCFQYTEKMESAFLFSLVCHGLPRRM